VVLYEEAALEHLLQRPPDALDVGGVHGAVGLGHVDPVAHPQRHRGELVDVALDRLAAPLVELGDSVGLDVALAREAELLLHGDLDGQAVAVPAGLADHMAALHRLEAREDVLEDAGLDMVHAGLAVGGRRSLVEGPGLALLGLCEGLRERVLAVPELEDLPFQRRQVDLRGDRGVSAGAHGWCSFVGVLPAKGRGVRRAACPPRSPRGTTLLGRRRESRPPTSFVLLPVLVTGPCRRGAVAWSGVLPAAPG
jgi:hypothetical protein